MEEGGSGEEEDERKRRLVQTDNVAAVCTYWKHPSQDDIDPAGRKVSVAAQEPSLIKLNFILAALKKALVDTDVCKDEETFLKWKMK